MDVKVPGSRRRDIEGEDRTEKEKKADKNELKEQIARCVEME